MAIVWRLLLEIRFGVGGHLLFSIIFQSILLLVQLINMLHVVFQGSFAVITVALIVGALGERIRFSALLIFTVIWFTFSYIPIAHMVWGGEGGWLIDDGALDFCGEERLSILMPL